MAVANRVAVYEGTPAGVFPDYGFDVELPDGHNRQSWYFPFRPGTVRSEVEDEGRFRRVVLPPVRMGEPNTCAVENGKLG